METFRHCGLLIGRLLLAVIFVHEGYTLATNFAGTADYMAKQGISASLLVAVIALQAGAGLSLVFGIFTRIGAMALGLLCLATAFMFHTDLASQNELLHFEKDLGLAGGMFVLAVTGAGALSVDHFIEPYIIHRFMRRT